MGLSARNPEDIINIALVRIGYKRRIGSIFDGSLASKAALDIYAQTRDASLRDFDWGFASRNAPMALLKTAQIGGYPPTAPWTNAFPVLPFIYEYAYPDDCLKVRSIRSSPTFIPVFDPKPVVYQIDNDNSLEPPAKVILCNVADAILVYTGQVTDPALWESDFIEALAASLARRFAPVLADINAEKLEAQDEGMETQQAEMRLG